MLDLTHDRRNGGLVQIIRGGIGKSFVEVRMVSQMNKGLLYNLTMDGFCGSDVRNNLGNPFKTTIPGFGYQPTSPSIPFSPLYPALPPAQPSPILTNIGLNDAAQNPALGWVPPNYLPSAPPLPQDNYNYNNNMRDVQSPRIWIAKNFNSTK